MTLFYMLIFAVNVPSPPLNLKATTRSSESIHLQWEAPASPSGVVSRYRVFYYQDGDTEERTIDVDHGDMTQHTLNNLNKFTNYNFQVVAYNENGPGTATEEVTARTYSDGGYYCSIVGILIFFFLFYKVCISVRHLILSTALASFMKYRPRWLKLIYGPACSTFLTQNLEPFVGIICSSTFRYKESAWKMVL